MSAPALRQTRRHRPPGARRESGLRCDSGGESPAQLRARIAITREGAYLSLIWLEFKHHNIEVTTTFSKTKNEQVSMKSFHPRVD